MVAVTEPFRITDAPGFRCGSAAWTVKNTPTTLVRSRSSTILSSVCPTGVAPPMPALANTTSSPPRRSAASATARSVAATSPASAWIATTSPPSARAAASSLSLLRPVIATRAPSARNSLAVAKPIPLLPPVIRAVLPSSRILVSSANWCI